MSIKYIKPGTRMTQAVVHGSTVNVAGQVAADPVADVKKQTLDPEWFKEFEFPLDKPPKPGSFCLCSAATGASVCAGARTFVATRNKNGLRGF